MRTWLVWGSLCLAVIGTGCHRSPPTTSVPATTSTRFPATETPMQDAPDFAPLLSAASLERFAWNRDDSAYHVRRGETLTVTFNRAVVAPLEVGRPVTRLPLEFVPRVTGTGVWIAPHVFAFTAEPAAFDRGVVARVRPSPSLVSRAGELLGAEEVATVVFDSARRIVGHEAHVREGQSLTFFFDGPVVADALSRDLLVYEIGGGERSLGFTTRSLSPDEDHRYPVELRLSASPGPGQEIGVAFTPRWGYGGRVPTVRTVMIDPWPHLVVRRSTRRAYAGDESYDEDESSTPYGASRGRSTPTDAAGVYVVHERLELASTHPLSLPSIDAFTFAPPVEHVAVSLADDGYTLRIDGDFVTGRTYALRIGALTTAEGVALRTTPPLALRSDGLTPDVALLGDGTTCELAGPCELAVRASNAASGVAFFTPIGAGDEAKALLGRVRIPGTARETSLASIVPEMSTFRAAFGAFEPFGTARTSGMGLLRLEPVAGTPPRAVPSFVQRTNLASTVIALDRTIVTWVTSLDAARPIEGARVAVTDGAPGGHATTDAAGLVEVQRVARPANGADPRSTIVATLGDDRSALAFAAAPPVLTDVAERRGTILVDRGAYRPGDRVSAVAFLREVRGARATPISGLVTRLRLVDGAHTTIADTNAAPAPGGRLLGTLGIPANAAEGWHAVELVDVATATVLASADVRVASFPEPRLRLDVRGRDGVGVGSGAFEADVVAKLLSGAALPAAVARVRLVRTSDGVSRPGHERFVFGPLDAQVFARTEHEGEMRLDAEGSGRVSAPYALDVRTRVSYRLDVEVDDPLGERADASTSFTAMPASFEVGVEPQSSFVRLGDPLRADVVAIDANGTRLVGKALRVRFLRTGWDAYWQRNANAESGVAARRARHDDVAHECVLASASEPVRCVFANARAGRYRIEVSASDEARRESVAETEVFVAGPDDDAEADRPSREVRVVASRTSVHGGESIDVAFECPFEDAEALVAVTTDRLLHAERRRVHEGGVVVPVRFDDSAVPNARVHVVIAKPRTGPVARGLDRNAPDFRHGSVDVAVRPRESSLTVDFERLPSSVSYGTNLPVSVRVSDARGGVGRAHVVVWAVDEGVLRLTGYEPSVPNDGLFTTRVRGEAFEDLRSTLRGLVPLETLARGSGDGGEDAGGTPDAPLPRLARFEPTVLFVADAVTDAEGRVRVSLPAGERATELRLMAAAIDDGVRAGTKSAALSVRRDVVLTLALPQALTEGDAFAAEASVANATTEPVRGVLVVRAGNATRRHDIVLGPRETRVFPSPMSVSSEGRLGLSFALETDHGNASESREIVVRRRVANETHRALGTFDRKHVIDLAIPAYADSGSVVVRVGRGRAVDARALVERLESTTFPDVERDAALLTIASHALDDGDASSTEEREATLRAGRESLERLRAEPPLPPERIVEALRRELVVLHALTAARDAFHIPEDELRGHRNSIHALAAREEAFAVGDTDRLVALILRLDREGFDVHSRRDAAYTLRTLASRTSAARLASCYPTSDSRRSTLVAQATKGLDQIDPRAYVGDPERVVALLSLGRDEGPLAHYQRGLEDALSELVTGGGLAPLDLSRAFETLAAHVGHDARRPELVATLDGTPVVPTASGRVLVYAFEARKLRGASHRLVLEARDEGLHAYELRATHPVADPSSGARGRGAYVVRRFETLDGRALGPSETVPRGALVRVRLLLLLESTNVPLVVSSPDPGGFERRAARSSAVEEISAILGSDPSDVLDPRTAIAETTLGCGVSRSVRGESTVFEIQGSCSGLRELTYVVRASHPGTYGMAPVTIESGAERAVVSTSGFDRLTVVP